MTKPPPKLNEPQVDYTSSIASSEAPHPSRDGFTGNSPSAAEIDLSQLEHNLALTPEERLIEHQHALELALALEAAGRKLRDESQ